MTLGRRDFIAFGASPLLAELLGRRQDIVQPEPGTLAVDFEFSGRYEHDLENQLSSLGFYHGIHHKRIPLTWRLQLSPDALKQVYNELKNTGFIPPTPDADKGLDTIIQGMMGDKDYLTKNGFVASSERTEQGFLKVLYMGPSTTQNETNFWLNCRPRPNSGIEVVSLGRFSYYGKSSRYGGESWEGWANTDSSGPFYEVKIKPADEKDTIMLGLHDITGIRARILEGFQRQDLKVKY